MLQIGSMLNRKVEVNALFRFLSGIRKSSSFGNVSRVVYQSLSHDIFTNLALEDWFYRNWNFDDKHLLLLWRNDPCVVIGRHQNPWNEANLHYLTQNNINISRRNSGGGTVYHDLGNVNCSFFTHRAQYNRKRNLEFICEALRQEWDLDVQVSPREDIMLNEHLKISGTASKLGNKIAYHHCTLLINVDSSQLHQTLRAPDLGMESKATASVRSPVINLSLCNPLIQVEKVCGLIGHNFLRHCLRSGQMESIDPTEENFPGLEKIREELCSWEWIFGKTPRFLITWPLGDQSELKLEVYHGIIEKTTISLDGSEINNSHLSDLLTRQKLNPALYENVVQSPLAYTLGSEASARLVHLLSLLCVQH